MASSLVTASIIDPRTDRSPRRLSSFQSSFRYAEVPTNMPEPKLRAVEVPIQWNSKLSVYASRPFLESVGESFGWIGGIDPNGALRCVLPYTIVRKGFLRMVRFRVETIPQVQDFSIEEEKVFLTDAMRHFRSLGAHLVIPATTNTIFRTYPDGAEAAPYGTVIMDLTLSEEALWNGMSSNHRRQVRQAQKAGVQVRTAPEHIGIAHEIFRDTFARSNLPFMDLNAFRRMLTGLGEQQKLLVAEFENRVQGCIAVPFSGAMAYYAYGGSIDDAVPGAMHLLHWEAMRLFRSLGVEKYDFVGVRIDPEKGSKQEGLLTFKQRFGGQLVRGFLWKYPINRIFYALYGLAARYRSGGDIVDQERHKLRPSSPKGSAPANAASLDTRPETTARASDA